MAFALWTLIGGIAAAQEVKVGAGAAPTENVFLKIKEPMEAATGLKLVLISNGPVEALKELDKGSVHAASGGLTFPDWMTMMEKDGYAIADKTIYKSRVIGKDVIKVLTHKTTGVSKLSKDQLKAIFTGKITNWKDVGGADLPVVLVWGEKIPGTHTVFQKEIMDGEPYEKKGAVLAGTAQDVKEKVAATAGGMGLGPVSVVDGSVLVPEIPEVGRPITLITKGAPSSDVLKMLEFIQGEGQKYLAK
ncbi:MAG: substrate-binding domain-containing protein [Syntrophobacteraceae bacterium]